LLSSCSTFSYYSQSVGGHLDLMSKRRSIVRLIRDERLPMALRNKLKLALEIREFASRELALPENSSYRSYVDIRRRYVVWNVLATPEFSLRPVQSCFPIVGCLVYRGYYRKQAALAYARKMKSKGYEVYVGGVPAYSTLGWFSDPVLSSMLHWSEAEMAGFIFHELAHQLVYIKDDTVFNESFATVVEREGVRRWMRQRHDEKAWRQWQTDRRRDQQVVTLVMQVRDELRRLYHSGTEKSAMRRHKRVIFRKMRVRYLAMKKQWGGYKGYDAWVLAKDMNNARIASVATYFDLVPAFEKLLARCKGNLPRFYRYIRNMPSFGVKQRRRELKRLGLSGCGE
jgi:predicted aminopeptidase